jgi:two-component system LytT family response regulator
MNKYKAIIVDDEERARRYFSNLITTYVDDSVEVVATCANVPEAVIAINKFQPDVVFLDIEMPDYNGFELLQFLKK